VYDNVGTNFMGDRTSKIWEGKKRAQFGLCPKFLVLIYLFIHAFIYLKLT